MRKPLNQLYDDFFSTPTPSLKQEEAINHQEVSEPTPYPSKEHHLEKYVLGQDQALKALENAMKRPQLMEKNYNTLLVCGKKGTGKHTLLCRFHEYLYVENFLSCKHPTYIRLDNIQDEMTFIQDLYSALQTPRHMIVFENIDQCEVSLLTLIKDLCENGQLILKQRYSIQKDKLTLATSQLEKNLISTLNANQHYFVFLTHQSYTSLSQQLGNQMMALINDVIETKTLTQDIIFELTKQDLSYRVSQIKTQCHTDIAFDPTILDYLSHFYSNEEGYHAVLNKMEDLHQSLITYLLNHPDSNHQLSYQNESLTIDHQPLLQNDNLQEVLMDIQQEMDDIIGLEKVKEYIYSLRDFIQLNQRRQAQGLKTEEVSMHMIFTGNPGTGKTTMARLMAKYLKALGILKNGQLLEVTRADLVASYVGQTAPKTKQVIEASLGGVLFIDEAYSLYRGKEDSFGLEAIDMLVKGMEDHRDNLVVVLAGYTKEMSTFLEANSGLKSRFANVIEFPDYTGEQLLQIAISQATKKQYQISEGAQVKLLDYFTFMQSLQDKRSGNGRLARNVIEDAILKQATRISKDMNASLTELIEADFILDA